jgi:hypothetical protein
MRICNGEPSKESTRIRPNNGPLSGRGYVTSCNLRQTFATVEYQAQGLRKRTLEQKFKEACSCTGFHSLAQPFWVIVVSTPRD